MLVTVNDIDGNSDDLVDKVFVQVSSLDLSSNFTDPSEYVGYYGSGNITLKFRVNCGENFYGSQCNIFCEPTDNSTGHYTCNSNGGKVCLDGWTDASSDCTTGKRDATVLSNIE